METSQILEIKKICSKCGIEKPLYINKRKKKPIYCIICNEKKKLQLACINHIYTKKLNNYIYLCSECHKLFDYCLKGVEYKKYI